MSASTRIVVTGPEPSELAAEAWRAIGVFAAEESRRRALAVELLILQGENDFRVGDVRYIVPTWRKSPVRRAKVEIGRWRYRRANR